MRGKLTPLELSDRHAGPVNATCFGASKKAYLVLTRMELQEMPLEWQQRFAAIMAEASQAGVGDHDAHYGIVRRAPRTGRIITDPWSKYQFGRCEEAAGEEDTLKNG